MAIVELSGVKKDYHTGETVVHALRGVDLQVEPGEFLAIAGPSGSGKTTLLNIVGTLDSADEGTVIIDHTDIPSLDPKERARFRRGKIGFVFQTFNLIPVLTAYENVAFALDLLDLPEREVRERTMQILKDVGLEGMEDRRPAQLSGGQQQRVAIARALVKNPILVLADEPTANLDSETGEAIVHLMQELNEKYGTTFIFSTHDKMVMDHARRLVLLHDGLIQEDIRRES
ncbi:ABC transporter ATP-binding protein [Spirochaeta thermophila]|uniref:ATP-binding/permease protein MacB n=1 Tax=Winmispira thermophila (strain ATCC 49972 / DSM 6192 / RI 19.B1) TaxID=665571 RepID=E0RNR0_WINT6|nr:ABC transporter ATP-binding protein [Spirochaeta thermophila]ADN01183.1 ATP-binding/permease protein MacB [Spirochaeta thermophila DSM 6192]